MEITITDGEGIPAGSILSIKCGTVHCQSVLEFNRPIYVPLSNVGRKNKNVSIGLLQEVCRETIPMFDVADESVSSECGGLDLGLGSNGDDVMHTVATEKPCHKEHTVDFKDATSRVFASLKLKTKDKASFLPTVHGTTIKPTFNASNLADGDVDGAVYGSKSRQHAAMNACKYLEDHDIAGLMRCLIQEMLQERPENPKNWLLKKIGEAELANGVMRITTKSSPKTAAINYQNGESNTNTTAMDRKTVTNRQTVTVDTALQEALRQSTGVLRLLDYDSDILQKTQMEVEGMELEGTHSEKAGDEIPITKEVENGPEIPVTKGAENGPEIPVTKGAENGPEIPVSKGAENAKGKLVAALTQLEIEDAKSDRPRLSSKGIPENMSKTVISQATIDINPELNEIFQRENCYCFRYLPEEDYKQILKSCVKKTIPKNHGKIFSEGDSTSLDENLYIIGRGRLRVLKDNILTSILSDGDVFGEYAFLFDVPRQATIETDNHTDNLLYVLDRDIFEDHIKNNEVMAKDSIKSQLVYRTYRDDSTNSYDRTPITDEYELKDTIDRYGKISETDERKLIIPKGREKLFSYLSKLWCFQYMTAGEMENTLNCFQEVNVDKYMPTKWSKPAGVLSKSGAENQAGNLNLGEQDYLELNSEGKILWFREGETSSNDERMYVIESGEVEIQLKGKKVGILRPGCMMGELSLVFDLPRQASCVIATPRAKLWALDRDDFDELLRFNPKFGAGEYSNLFYRLYPNVNNTAEVTKESSNNSTLSDACFAADGSYYPVDWNKSEFEIFEKEHDILFKLLSNLWVFRHLSASDFKQCVYSFKKESIKGNPNILSNSSVNFGTSSTPSLATGNVSNLEDYRILQEGSGSEYRGDYMYVIESGTVDCFQGDNHLRTLNKGDLFGELSFVYGLPRQASCFATSNKVVLWKLSRDDFFTYIGDNEEITGKHVEEYYKTYDNVVLQDDNALDLDDIEKGVLGGATAAGAGDGILQDNDLMMDSKQNAVIKNMKINHAANNAISNLNNTLLASFDLQNVGGNDDGMKPTNVVGEATKEMLSCDGKKASAEVLTLKEMLVKVWIFKYMKEKELIELIHTMKKHYITKESVRAQNAKSGENKGGSDVQDHADLEYDKKVAQEKLDAPVPYLLEGDALGSDASMYLIQGGRFEVYKQSEEGKDRRDNSGNVNGTLVNKLKKGDFFGELGFVYSLPRQATVSLSSEDATVWSIPYASFDKYIASNEEIWEKKEYFRSYENVDFESSASLTTSGAHRHDVDAGGSGDRGEENMGVRKTSSYKASTLRLEKMLEKTWVFKYLNEDDRLELKARCIQKKLSKPAPMRRLVLIEEHSGGGQGREEGRNRDDKSEDDCEMFLIESGTVEVFRNGVLVNTLGEGDIFGELSLIYDLPRQASCYLTSDRAVLWKIPSQVFGDLIKTNTMFTSGKHSKEYYRSYDNSKSDDKADLLANKERQKAEGGLVGFNLSNCEKILKKLIQKRSGANNGTSITFTEEMIKEIVQNARNKNVMTFAKGEDLPILYKNIQTKKEEASLYYIESGAVNLWEGFQLISNRTSGEMALEELLDTEFTDFLCGDLKVQCDADDTVLWRFNLEDFLETGSKKDKLLVKIQEHAEDSWSWSYSWERSMRVQTNSLEYYDGVELGQLLEASEATIYTVLENVFRIHELGGDM